MVLKIFESSKEAKRTGLDAGSHFVVHLLRFAKSRLRLHFLNVNSFERHREKLAWDQPKKWGGEKV